MHDLIHWPVFFAAIKRQRQRRTFNKWLLLWRFGDAGVVLRRDYASLVDGNGKLEKSARDLIKAQQLKRRGMLH